MQRDPLALRIEELTFAYNAKSEAIITELSAEFAPGQVTTITGASGTGKSTLLYILALMLKTSSGEVIWDDSPTSALSDAERSHLRARDVGFVFQDALLDPSRTILDNVCEAGLFSGLDPAIQKSRGTRLLERFGVGHRLDHRPGEISGGQAQRVALCRALLNQPRVIFGDEPTGNLDSDSARVVWDALKQEARNGATVIIATHDRSLAADADARLEL